MNRHLSRRSALRSLALGSSAAAVAATLSHRLEAAENAVDAALKGRVNHSVCKWCYPKVPLEDLCKAAREMGIQSVELLELKDLPVLKKHDLTCAVVAGVPGGIGRGLNRLEHHADIVAWMEKSLPAAAEAGAPNVICFSGNRNGLDDEKGLENCVIGLKQIVPLAEKHKVTVIMELLNSRKDHKDYQCDKSAWGVELCKRVGSERFKLDRKSVV